MVMKFSIYTIKKPLNYYQIHNGPPHPSNFGYSYAKRLIDITNRAYHEKFGSKFTSIIPCNVFGPYDNYKLEVSHVIPGMIRRMYDLIYLQNSEIPQEEKVFTVYGTGNPLRQFIYSLDLARLIIWALHNYDSIEPIILSVDEAAEVSIRQLAKSIASAFNFRGRIEFDTTKADGQHKKTASNQKLRLLYPSFQFTNFNEAIKDSVKWFIDNYSVARK